MRPIRTGCAPSATQHAHKILSLHAVRTSTSTVQDFGTTTLSIVQVSTPPTSPPGAAGRRGNCRACGAPQWKKQNLVAQASANLLSLRYSPGASFSYLSASDRAPGCPEPRPASAKQPLGPRYLSGRIYVCIYACTHMHMCVCMAVLSTWGLRRWHSLSAARNWPVYLCIGRPHGPKRPGRPVIHIHMHMHICMHICMHVHMHMHMMHMHMTYMYAYAYAYAYQARSPTRTVSTPRSPRAPPRQSSAGRKRCSCW